MAHTLQISITFDKVPFWCEKNLPETKNRSLLQWKEVTGALLKSTVFIACSENDIVVWTAKFGRFIIDFIIMECPIQELVSKGEEREYHQITASIMNNFYLLHNFQCRIWFVVVPRLKTGTFKWPWNLIIHSKPKNKEAPEIIFINIHLYAEKG